MGGIDVGEVGDRREGVGQRATGVVDRLAVGRDQPAGVGAGRRGGHLLAQYHPNGEFDLVHRARDALTGRLRHDRAQIRVRRQHLEHRFRVGVEVEKSPAAGDRGGQVAKVVEDQLAADVVGGRGERDDAGAVRQAQGAPIPAVAHLLTPGDGTGRQMTEHPFVGEWGAHRQPQRQRTGAGRGRLAVRAAGGMTSQLGGGAAADFPDRVIELADAGKPGREGDVAERQLGGFDQHPSGLGALCAGQAQRASPDFAMQQPLQLPGGVAQPGGHADDALAIDGPVGDQPHGAGHHVPAHIPLRRTGTGVGPAPLARPEAVSLGRRGGGVEPHVARQRRPHRATGAAIHARGDDRGHKPPVEAGVFGLHRAVAPVEVVVHTCKTYTPPATSLAENRHRCWRGAIATNWRNPAAVRRRACVPPARCRAGPTG
ncbi:hypothetical protein C1Y40_02235 [Mycobacterium talmoniae]|uniref:Uncharacterized protein n=1 Tax=Mycobacterium talmoniae TaxID=1858794 RepID=A0A2S8BLW0_9MYCO|nr:hypothetical protein C1Y40_02235 [Mycobacterium talmoniae]